jgi:PAS domain S-box-containing protein
MHDAVFSTSMDFKILTWNKAAERIYGWRAEEVMGREAAEILKTQIPDDERLRIRREFIEKGYWTGEYIQRDRQGNAIYVLASSVLLKDEDGVPIGIVTVNHDLTARKQIEDTLAEERKLLRTLIDAVPEYIYVKDLQHRFLLNNVAHAKARARSEPDALIGKTDFDLFPAELAERFRAAETEILRSGQPLLDFEEPGVDPEGNPIWSLSTKVPLQNLSGDLIGLVGITRDITARKQNEERIRQIERERDVLFEKTRMALAETESYARRLDALNAMSQQVNTASSEEAIFDVAAEYLTQSLTADQFAIFLTGSDPETLTVAIATGEQPVVRAGMMIPVRGSVVGEIARTGHTINLGDIHGQAGTLYAYYPEHIHCWCDCRQQQRPECIFRAG